jgi:hypothetical protein
MAIPSELSVAEAAALLKSGGVSRWALSSHGIPRVRVRGQQMQVLLLGETPDARVRYFDGRLRPTAGGCVLEGRLVYDAFTRWVLLPGVAVLGAGMLVFTILQLFPILLLAPAFLSFYLLMSFIFRGLWFPSVPARLEAGAVDWIQQRIGTR